ncbi:hypothetical protein T484DRAFT_1760480, partial [Baffinella frigidus]
MQAPHDLVWEEVLPRFPAAKSEPKVLELWRGIPAGLRGRVWVLELWRRGIPAGLRGRVWVAAVGNEAR